MHTLPCKGLDGLVTVVDDERWEWDGDGDGDGDEVIDLQSQIITTQSA